MGNYEVKYKPGRSDGRVGDVITDPNHFFRQILVTEFAAHQAIYNGLSDDKRQEFDETMG